MTVKKYVFPKVDAQGEDVIVDAKKFDGLLSKLLTAPPMPLAKLREESGRLAPRKFRKGSS
jgi:hypothetical protein